MTLAQKKLIGIVAVFLIYSFVLFIAIGVLIRSQFGASSVLAWIVGLFGLLWPALAAVTAAYTSGKRSAGTTVAVGSGIAVMAAGIFSIASIVGGVLMTILLLVAEGIVRQEMKTRIVFEGRLIFRRAVRILLLALLVSILGLAAPLVQDLVSSGEVAVTPQTTAAILRPAAPFLDSFIPGGYSGTKTIDTVIDAQIAEQLEGLPEGITIPSSAKQQAKSDLSSFLGTPVAGNETVPQLAAGYINKYIQELANQSGFLVSLVMIIIALLTLKAFIPLLAWPVLGLVSFLVWASQRIGLVYISQTQGTIERLYL